MQHRYLPVLLSIAAVAGCGSGRISVAASDTTASAAPVASAPVPEPAPEPTVPAAAPPPPPAPLPLPAPAPAPRPNAGRESDVATGYQAYGNDTGLPVRRIGQWSHSGIGESRRMVIRDANGWAQFWAELGAGERPRVDFTRNVAVAVAAGERPTGGYEIAVDRVTQSGGELMILVVELEPGPNCITTQALTRPVDVVVVPAAKVRGWSFEERREVRSCR